MFVRIAITIGAVAGLAAFAPAGASAATITPDVAFDEFTLDDGECSLREAVVSANENADIGGCATGDQVQGAYGAGVASDTIVIEATNYILTVPGAAEDDGLTGDLDVEGVTVLRGPEDATAVVDTNVADRIFDVRSGSARLTVEDALLSGGQSGGGGGIISASVPGGDVVLNDAVIDSGEAQLGGGIRVDGAGSSLVSNDSLFEDNTATSYGGAVSVGPNAAATFTRSRFITNDSLDTTPSGQAGGGGLHVQSGGSEVQVIDSHFEGNAVSSTSATADWAQGGAVFTLRDMRVDGSAFINNSVETDGPDDSFEYGGAFYIANPSETEVVNSTFFSNEAGNNNVPSEDARGGAFYKTGGILDISFSTFLQNAASNADGADALDNGNSGSALRFSASVFPAGENVCEGNFVQSQGYNVAPGDAECVYTGSDDVSGQPAGLLVGNPLDNGGPTLTLGLLPTSRAINQVPFGDCADSGGLDARNYPRTAPDAGAACDAGAYERSVCDGVVQNDDFTPCPPVLQPDPPPSGNQPQGTGNPAPGTPAKKKCKKAKKKKKKGKAVKRCAKKKKKSKKNGGR